jgi:hypothetical protein
MGRTLVVAALALAGLLCAAGMGLAAYVVSRDSVAVPVTKLQPAPQLTPARVKARVRTQRPIEHTPTTTRTVTTPTTTVDDHGGGGGSGSGSGRGGGGGHGSDD